MSVKIEKIKKDQSIILERLLQLYLHDVSLYFPIDFNEEKGLYNYDSLDIYFNGSSDKACFIMYDNKIAGFILYSETDDESCIQEIFISNSYKKQGLGKAAVFELLNQYPGNWIIRSLPNSQPAENFWLKTIREYTNNQYKIERIGKYNRAVFTFNN